MNAPRPRTISTGAEEVVALTAAIDGRTLRRTRNRTAVIDALLELIGEGHLQPAATEIADRAGVSHRSIFRYFDDLDDLVRTAIDQAFRESEPYARIEQLGVGTLDRRIAAFVDARLRLYMHVDGAMRVARMRAYSIPSIDEEVAAICVIARAQIREHFAPELRDRDRTTADFLVDGALVLTGYDSFAIHTRVLDSTTERIRAAWTVALTALLGPPREPMGSRAG